MKIQKKNSIQPERIRQRDSRNKSVLHYCAEQQQRDLVAAASIAIAAPELLESADEDGFTPLHLAVIQGNLAMVNLLLANKADVNAVDNEGHSVVHWATGEQHYIGKHFHWHPFSHLLLIERELHVIHSPNLIFSLR